MRLPRLRTIILTATVALGVAGCTTYDRHGYGGYYGAPRASIGLYSGWYDGYYYPGSGYYIYDRHGKRHRWSKRHRHYWEGRRHHYRRDRGDRRDDRRVVTGRYNSREEAIRARDEARQEARRDNRRSWRRGDRNHDRGDRRRSRRHRD